MVGIYMRSYKNQNKLYSLTNKQQAQDAPTTRQIPSPQKYKVSVKGVLKQ